MYLKFLIAELERLLGTAKDEERKEVIRKALASLDSPVKAQGKVAGNHAHLLNAQKVRHFHDIMLYVY